MPLMSRARWGLIRIARLRRDCRERGAGTGQGEGAVHAQDPRQRLGAVAEGVEAAPIQPAFAHVGQLSGLRHAGTRIRRLDE
jgi:hypothetical protein